jgi:hypothetical protein
MLQLEQLVADFGAAIAAADRKRPQAKNARTKEEYLPGFGPHAESDAVELVAAALRELDPAAYGADRLVTGVPYPDRPRQKCDLCIGQPPAWEWCVEVKMLRFLGDNGKPNDNILMHILSPYPGDRSALTDVAKLVTSALNGRKAIIIYGFDHETITMDLAIDAFERLAPMMGRVGLRSATSFDGLVHPHHARGRVFGWEVLPQSK